MNMPKEEIAKQQEEDAKSKAIMREEMVAAVVREAYLTSYKTQFMTSRANKLRVLEMIRDTSYKIKTEQSASSAYDLATSIELLTLLVQQMIEEQADQEGQP